jgi:hypothetical protein
MTVTSMKGKNVAFAIASTGLLSVHDGGIEMSSQAHEEAGSGWHCALPAVPGFHIAEVSALRRFPKG